MDHHFREQDQQRRRRLWLHVGLILFSLYLVLLGGQFAAIFDPGLAGATALLGGGMVLLGSVVAGRAPGRWQAVDTAAVLVLLAGTFATGASVYRRAGEEALCYLVLSVGLYFVGSRTTPFPGPRQAVSLALVVGMGTVVLYGLGQASHLVPVLGPPILTESGHLRLAATLHHPNNLAGFLVLLIPLAGSFLWSCYPPWGRLLTILTTLAAGTVLAWTYSRGGYLGAVTAGAIYLGLVLREALRPRLRWRPRRVWGWGLAGVLLLGLGLFLGRNTPVGQRARLALDRKHFTVQERVHLWQTSVEMVRARPLTGWGPETYGLVYPNVQPLQYVSKMAGHAHNTYLHLLAEQGLPGLAAFLVFLGLLLRAGFRHLRVVEEPPRRLLLIGLLAGLGGFLVAGLFDYNLGIPTTRFAFWTFLGLLAGLVREETRRPGDPETEGGDERGKKVFFLFLGLLTLFCTGCLLHWNRSQVWFARGVTLAQAGQWEEARSWVERARRGDPCHAYYQAQYALSFAAEALQPALLPARRRALLEQSAAELERFLAEPPAPALPPLRRGRVKDAAYFHALAWVDWRLERKARALVVMQQAIDHHRNDPVGYVDRGWMLWEEGRAAEAEAAFRQAWRIHPPPASAAYFLGQLAERRGRPAEAIRWYREGLALPPDWIRDHFSHLEASYGRLGLPLPAFVTRPLLDSPASARKRLEAALARVSSSS